MCGLLSIVLSLACVLIIKGAIATSLSTKQDQTECHASNAILNCPHYTDISSAELTWRFKDKSANRWRKIAAIKTGNQKLFGAATASFDDRLTLHVNGSLGISSVKRDDQTMYQCRVKNAAGRDIHSIKLSVACHGNIRTRRGRAAMTTAYPVNPTVVVMGTSESVVSKVCGGILGTPVGGFESPNFPNNYPANSHCEWTISVPQPYAAIDITLHEVNLENEDNCHNDYLAVYNALGNQVGCRHCGVHSSPIKFQVKGRVAVVVFHADSTVHQTGFKLTYEAALPAGTEI